jgi:deferrochelatase/peroxidase EfeB
MKFEILLPRHKEIHCKQTQKKSVIYLKIQKNILAPSATQKPVFLVLNVRQLAALRKTLLKRWRWGEAYHLRR